LSSNNLNVIFFNSLYHLVANRNDEFIKSDGANVLPFVRCELFAVRDLRAL
jgi:hypothetical protein